MLHSDRNFILILFIFTLCFAFTFIWAFKKYNSICSQRYLLYEKVHFSNIHTVYSDIFESKVQSFFLHFSKILPQDITTRFDVLWLRRDSDPCVLGDIKSVNVIIVYERHLILLYVLDMLSSSAAGEGEIPQIPTFWLFQWHSHAGRFWEARDRRRAFSWPED